MMHQGDYSYYQHANPPLTNPNPVPNSNLTPSDPHYAQTPSYASAPPFSSNYDYSSVHPGYPPYNTNIDQSHPLPPPVPAPQSTFLQQPASQPGFNQPQQSQPSFNQPQQSQPSFNQPQQSQPSFNQPQQSQPGFNQPAPSQSSFNQPLPSQPAPNFSPFDSHAPSFAQPSSLPNYATSFEPNQIPSTHVPPPVYTPPSSSFNPPYSSVYPLNYDSTGSPSKPPAPYDTLFENPSKYDSGLGYFDGKYNRSNSDSNSSFTRQPESSRYDDLYGDGVYRYEGGKHEPYGARGTSSKSSNWEGFDDFGRAINAPSSASEKPNPSKIVRAVPKIDTQQDSKGGVQKFRVKLLAESAGQSTMDVLCQIGLDGIRMLDPSSNRTQRIYPLENITRCDKLDSSTFAFWSKSAVDIEPKRIRLQSSGYTVNTLLDTVTAATVQFKEMGGAIKPVESKPFEQPVEKKKGIADWMNMIKPGNEEKDHWVPDEAVSKCTGCGTDFSAFNRKHHCRNCGDIFCDKCTHGRIALTAEQNAQPVRVCDRCLAEVTQRLSNAKEASKPSVLASHEDLAKKLQDEMEKNRKSSSGAKSDAFGRRMKEVECPTCTVHLQVQVPVSGSETIECGVCQRPFLVSAH